MKEKVALERQLSYVMNLIIETLHGLESFLIIFTIITQKNAGSCKIMLINHTFCVVIITTNLDMVKKLYFSQKFNQKSNAA
ncbi:hypothetical protein PRUPE_1G264400 [Prunus persica]|uniref:Uncharacterized protein n=1 Tax=Prunus persica TaxID=3760 RepID=M5XAW4_PRUPE|nr:hypothetical protein PRUPE_1G264400 [Prunus persica]